MKHHQQRNLIFMCTCGFFLLTVPLILGYGHAASNTIIYDSERAIGQCLALEGFQKFGPPLEDQELQKYVNLVGNSIVRNIAAHGRTFSFVVIKSPLSGSFALPGGIVLITSNLFKALQSEAELACVLAYNIAHITGGHALLSIDKTTLHAHKSNFDGIIEQLKTALYEGEYPEKFQNRADVAAMELAYRTGYNPESFIKALPLIAKKGSSAERMRRCIKNLLKYPDFSTLAENKQRFGNFRKTL
ncbi:MAG: M48 family metalloprotease [bacterium]